MLKYITFGGVAISVLVVFSEIGIHGLGDMRRLKRETGIPVKIQIKNKIKTRQS